MKNKKFKYFKYCITHSIDGCLGRFTSYAIVKKEVKTFLWIPYLTNEVAIRKKMTLQQFNDFVNTTELYLEKDIVYKNLS